MFRNLVVLLTVACSLSSIFAAPIQRREVPQEHSHNQFLDTVRTSLNLNNPAAIQDPVFGLLGNAAAAGGAGKITDATCLQQATADQAFTNAKAKGDVNGQVAALIYRALERNSGQVGLVTAPCTSIKAVNPEIAAIQQHQDPASTNAAAVNKAIVLELAKQIAAVGGNPQDALKSGTFAPGNLNDSTGKGNTCDTASDAVGCIFTQNLLVDDATAAEIDAAVSGVAAAGPAVTPTPAAAGAKPTATGAKSKKAKSKGAKPTATGAKSKAAGAKPTTAGTAATEVAAVPTAAASTAGNLQTFTGALGGVAAPPVTAGGRGFLIEGDSFLNEAGALGRSCDIQHNGCSDAANSAAGRASGLTTGQCDTQNTQCHAAI